MYKQIFKGWQTRILIAMMIGYSGFYFIRNNMPLAFDYIHAEHGFSKLQLGCIISSFHILYGIGKGISGVISDRCNARYFMTIGLLGASIANFGIFFSKSLSAFIIFWSFNAIFQSMGWPTCAKLLTHWFSKKELGTKWALWNTSQQIGVLSTYLFAIFAIYIEKWRFMFLIPALITIFISIFVFIRLRDNPTSVGFNTTKKDISLDQISFKDFLLKNVYKNQVVLLICFANFFFYFVRMSIISWAPTFLLEFRGNQKIETITYISIYEISGMIGGITAGYLSDKIGDRGKISLLFMLGITICIWMLWKTPINSPISQFFIIMMVGFFMSGPQILIGVLAADAVSKKVVGAAAGLTGVFGYLGGSLTGIGSGYILDRLGWSYFFMTIIFACMIGCFLLFLTQKIRQKETEPA